MDISLSSQDPRNCELCEYEAENMYDFDAHTWELHMSSAEDGPNHIPCTFCDETFENNRDLMNHKKKEHTDKGEIVGIFLLERVPMGNKGVGLPIAKKGLNQV